MERAQRLRLKRRFERLHLAQRARSGSLVAQRAGATSGCSTSAATSVARPVYTIVVPARPQETSTCPNPTTATARRRIVCRPVRRVAQAQRDARRRGHHRRGGAHRLQLRGGQRRPQERGLRSDRRIQERPGRSRSPGRRLRLGGHRRHRKRLRRHHPVARQGQAPGLVAGAGELAGVGRLRHRHRHRQGQGRPHGAGQRHPRLPARLAARHAPGQGPDALRGQDAWSSRSSSSTASATTSCCRRRAVVEASHGRRARQAARDADRRRHRARRGQEHHRVRRVRRPRRHRRPAAHHRHGVAPRAPPERGGAGRPGAHRQGAEVRRREEPRLARHQAARRRPVARRVAPLPERHAPVRQGHQHRRLRRVRRDRARHRRPGARLRDGLDQQERRAEQGRHARATRSRSWCSRSTKTSAASAWA